MFFRLWKSECGGRQTTFLKTIGFGSVFAALEKVSLALAAAKQLFLKMSGFVVFLRLWKSEFGGRQTAFSNKIWFSRLGKVSLAAAKELFA